MDKNLKLAVIGLGYVGLPLALLFGNKYKTIGLDLSINKIYNYKKYTDPNNEIEKDLFIQSKYIEFTTDPKKISQANIIIIAVPTPVDKSNRPDFAAVISASETAGRFMQKKTIVVYESTVYPGATEEVCIPILEKFSKMKWKKDFNVGYSPERINPGDKERSIDKIIKVVSGDNSSTLKILSKIYSSVIPAGIHQAPSIKVAEAAKVIENTQRDLNISLMNELSIIFDLLNINTNEVLEAASTKWNFLRFSPGLVGGHCIGVDPYYLTYKSEQEGYHPQVILAGRKINDGMPEYIAKKTIKLLIKNNLLIRKSKIIILGLTFKENCSDLRNSKVYSLISELEEYGVKIFVHDPLASKIDAKKEYSIQLKNWDDLPDDADVLIAAVSHDYYSLLPINKILSKIRNNGIFIDIKSQFSKTKISRMTNLTYWQL